MEFTPELLQRAAGAQDAGALAELARSEGLTLTLEQAEDYFAKLHPPAGELADDELDAVSGGGCGGMQSQAPNQLTNGMTVNMGNEKHCQECGHQATFRVWNVRPVGGGGYSIGKIQCPACRTMYENKNGTFEKSEDQSNGRFGPMMA